MKTQAITKKWLAAFLLTGILGVNMNAQNQQKTTTTQGKPTVVVLNIDSKGVIQDAEAVGYLVRLELEKVNVHTLLDKYDVSDAIKKNNIDVANCYGKTCLVNVGKILNADKMVTGSVERFGEKIVITLKLIDVKSENVERSNTTEYQNLQQELQKMVEVSVKRLVGVEPDKTLVDVLVNVDAPIASAKTQVKLNGPRMGFSMSLGDAGKRLQDSKEVGGFDMYPVTFQFGFQKEFQYLSAGDFQALIEFIGLVGGLESGKFIPSVTVLNGFRFNKGGWEVGFGPSFRLVQKADGFFDTEGYLGKAGDWRLVDEYNAANAKDFDNKIPDKLEYSIVSRLDSRGTTQLSTGLVLAAGKTFKSGYLNMPVNLYVSPRKDGWLVGFSFGFNIYKKPKVQ